MHAPLRPIDLHPETTLQWMARLRKRLLIGAAATALIGAVAFTARAEELRPIQAKSLQLGDVNGVAYYTVEDHGYRLVATLAGQGGTPVRFEGTLLPEQKVVVSIPGVAGAKSQTVEFLRRGDRLLVESKPVQTE
jgi:hypothetical protein